MENFGDEIERCNQVILMVIQMIIKKGACSAVLAPNGVDSSVETNLGTNDSHLMLGYLRVRL